ncbi:hypothetical protein C8F04DRAFT_1252800 [Mycena alexandri]|uniref:Uncharacterized protein n=1 Tax=Mycena alexandri TaxID=1745969 RepID=A0AAD6X9C4_9AGAR|nr:hypothetical protein C8F04DRAFT_1256752 [Mycena alexandri]KAJ7041467.1 hypothetical protein C8F04DRAFT_1252800 [Mycena alexandri]
MKSIGAVSEAKLAGLHAIFALQTTTACILWQCTRFGHSATAKSPPGVHPDSRPHQARRALHPDGASNNRDDRAKKRRRCRDDFTTFIGLCVNSANEPLQAQVQDTVFAEHTTEGLIPRFLPAAGVPFVDNAEYIRLLQNNPGGKARKAPKKMGGGYLVEFEESGWVLPSFTISHFNGPSPTSPTASLRATSMRSIPTFSVC